MVHAWKGNQNDNMFVLVGDTLYSRRQSAGGWSVWSTLDEAERLQETDDTEHRPAWGPASVVAVPA